MEREYLEGCLAKGMSLKAIAREHGCSPGTVGYWVKRHGLVANGSRKFSPGKGLAREPLATLVAEGRTLGQIARELGVGINTVRYWIGRHGLPSPKDVRRESRALRIAVGDTRGIGICHRHGETEFVLDNRKDWRCCKCRAEAVVKRRRKVKRILVEEAGGKCIVCGYDRFPGALHFHHLDPTSKRFGLAEKGHTLALAMARTEASKCVLVCANCHAEIEAGITELPMTKS